MIIRIFAPSVLAKPLNNAQMCEAFLFLWVYGNKVSKQNPHSHFSTV